jgi:hypothetical protein
VAGHRCPELMATSLRRRVSGMANDEGGPFDHGHLHPSGRGFS